MSTPALLAQRIGSQPTPAKVSLSLGSIYRAQGMLIEIELNGAKEIVRFGPDTSLNQVFDELITRVVLTERLRMEYQEHTETGAETISLETIEYGSDAYIYVRVWNSNNSAIFSEEHNTEDLDTLVQAQVDWTPTASDLRMRKIVRAELRVNKTSSPIVFTYLSDKDQSLASIQTSLDAILNTYGSVGLSGSTLEFVNSSTEYGNSMRIDVFELDRRIVPYLEAYGNGASDGNFAFLLGRLHTLGESVGISPNDFVKVQQTASLDTKGMSFRALVKAPTSVPVGLSWRFRYGRVDSSNVTTYFGDVAIKANHDRNIVDGYIDLSDLLAGSNTTLFFELKAS